MKHAKTYGIWYEIKLRTFTLPFFPSLHNLVQQRAASGAFLGTWYTSYVQISKFPCFFLCLEFGSAW